MAGSGYAPYCEALHGDTSGSDPSNRHDKSHLIRPIPSRFVQHGLPHDMRLAEVFFEGDGVALGVFAECGEEAAPFTS